MLASTPLHLPQTVPSDATSITFSRVSAPLFIAFNTSLTVNICYELFSTITIKININDN